MPPYTSDVHNIILYSATRMPFENRDTAKAKKYTRTSAALIVPTLCLFSLIVFLLQATASLG